MFHLMVKSTHVMVRMPPRLIRDIDAARDGTSRAAYVRACVEATLRRGEDAHVYREVQVTPAGDRGAEQVLEWLASRQPTWHDFSGRTPTASARLNRILGEVCTPVERRRIRRHVFEGAKLEEIGQAEGASRQAVFCAVQSGLKKLARSDDFLAFLVDVFPETGLTVTQLKSIWRDRNAAKRRV